MLNDGCVRLQVNVVVPAATSRTSLFDDLNISKLLFQSGGVGGGGGGGGKDAGADGAARLCGREKEETGIFGGLKVGAWWWLCVMAMALLFNLPPPR